MAIKHNQKLVKNHFRKDWKRRVRCHFDQPGRKLRRRTARQTKAAAVAPRPVDKLRPVVRCPTIKYNRKVRTGRGFSLAELKEAKIPRLFAPTIGIAVDHRRQNRSQESMDANVARLKEYMSRLILLPRKSNKAKKGETSHADMLKAQKAQSVAALMPLPAALVAVHEIAKKDMPAQIEGGAYMKLRFARSNARFAGMREKRAREKAEAEAAKK